jgi:hypothetical protein
MTTPEWEPGAWGSEPLIPEDPPKIGDFWLTARRLSTPSGIVYEAHGEGAKVLLLLLSSGAATDAAARARFSGLVNELHVDTVAARGGHGQDDGRLGSKYRSEDDDPVEPDEDELAPWVALIDDGSQAATIEAQRLLDEVALVTLPHQGTPSGPDYRLHWIDDTRPGMARLWPLPWPGRHDRAGWVSILVSWLLMLLIAALAVLISILIFQNNNAGSPPPPVPTSASGGGSGSPQSGEPTESGSESASPTESGSGSPNPSSGGPVPSHTKTPTFVSPSQGGTESGGGSSETPNDRLIIQGEP